MIAAAHRPEIAVCGAVDDRRASHIRRHSSPFICALRGILLMTRRYCEEQCMEKKFKTLDIGDLRPFASGGTGDCYRLGEDTILKLYYEGFPEARVLREKAGARAALVAGVPTAISFETVKVGNREGVVYERVCGATMSELVARHPARAGELGGMFAHIALSLHEAPVNDAGLPRPTESIRAELSRISYAPEETVASITAFMDELDRDIHYVHGDFHPNNVIMTDNGPMLIDMGSFSVGSPMFDLASTYFSLFESPEAIAGGRSAFNGLDRGEALAFWEGFERAYFGAAMDAAQAELLKRVMLLKKLRFERLYGSRFSPEYCASIRRDVLTAFGNGQGR